jgi:hypothetical protein
MVHKSGSPSVTPLYAISLKLLENLQHKAGMVAILVIINSVKVNEEILKACL